MTDKNNCELSVVIPTFNRCNDLKRCLGALLLQSFKDFEILIVDNGCSDGTAELLKKYPVRVVKDLTRSVTHLFNIGWRSTKCKVVVFTNDDSAPVANWLEEINSVFEKFPEAGAVGGPTLLPQECMDNQEMIRLERKARHSLFLGPFSAVYESLVLEGKFKEVGVLCESGAYSAGGSLLESTKLSQPISVDLLSITNAAIKRSVLEELNGLDENFIFTHGDGDLFIRIKQHGYKLIFAPKAIVWHHVNPGGDTRSAFWRGRDQAYFLKKCIKPKSISARLRFLLNIIFFNAFWVFKSIEKMDPDFLRGISGFFRGLSDFSQQNRKRHVF